MFLLMIFSSLVASPHYHFSYLGQYDNGYPQDKYEEILNHFSEVYTPIIAAEGGSFHILSDWSDGAVNMWAFRIGQEYWLEIPGGMSRYHLINEEAFVLSICHELGHLLGGEPQRGDISYEGQADYFSTHRCVTQMLAVIEPHQELTIDPEVELFCADSDHSNCQRILMGAMSLSSYYAELADSPAPRISTASTEVVSTTLTTHPPAQCRFDTFFAGFLGEDRPPCWFAE